MKFRPAILTLLAAGLFPAVGPAQHLIGARPGLCTFAQGAVKINGDTVPRAGRQTTFIDRGGELATQGGFAEALLGETTVLRTGSVSRVRLVSDVNDDVVIELISGSVVIDLADRWGREKVTVRTPKAVVEVKKLGVYRFDIGEQGPPTLRVFQGKAKVLVDGAEVSVPKGRSAVLSPIDEPEELAQFDKADLDFLDRWSVRRRKSAQSSYSWNRRRPSR